jgi:Kef-type K+ transport system membrane component KefB
MVRLLVSERNTKTKMKKLILYIFLLTIFSYLTLLLISKNSLSTNEKNEIINYQNFSLNNDIIKTVIDGVINAFKQYKANTKHTTSLLLLQIIIILFTSRVFGIVFKKMGQQTVIGEIIAGILLGPSLFGWLFPGYFSIIFPSNSFLPLQFLSQIGLTFFMFVIGMELEINQIRNKAQDALIISHTSIFFSFFLGTYLSLHLYNEFAPKGISFLSFSLFMGISMSITAFPVLARIIKERGLTKKPIGILAITCAATDDITAWCLLAVIIAIIKAGSIASSLVTIGLAITFIILMIYFVKPWLQKIINKRNKSLQNDKFTIAIAFCLLFLSAYATEIIGIHALFGAFIAGVIMPNNFQFKETLSDKIEDVSTIIFLPIFFALTGLRTQIGLLNDAHLWIISSIIICTAVIGKFVGSTLTAKMIGESWKDSLSLGALMNTRGLMELIVLNIGYDLGVFGPEIFSILVVMALFTTFMTGPTLDLIEIYFNRFKKNKTTA